MVNWNGNALTTQFISQSRLTATVPASRITKAQTASISVVNPATLISNVAYFAVVSPVAYVVFSGAQFHTSGKTPSASIAADFNGEAYEPLEGLAVIESQSLLYNTSILLRTKCVEVDRLSSRSMQSSRPWAFPNVCKNRLLPFHSANRVYTNCVDVCVRTTRLQR
jgi:hypothetical protein